MLKRKEMERETEKLESFGGKRIECPDKIPNLLYSNVLGVVSRMMCNV